MSESEVVEVGTKVSPSFTKLPQRILDRIWPSRGKLSSPQIHLTFYYNSFTTVQELFGYLDIHLW